MVVLNVYMFAESFFFRPGRFLVGTVRLIAFASGIVLGCGFFLLLILLLFRLRRGISGSGVHLICRIRDQGLGRNTCGQCHRHCSNFKFFIRHDPRSPFLSPCV